MPVIRFTTIFFTARNDFFLWQFNILFRKAILPDNFKLIFLYVAILQSGLFCTYKVPKCSSFMGCKD